MATKTKGTVSVLACLACAKPSDRPNSPVEVDYKEIEPESTMHRASTSLRRGESTSSMHRSRSSERSSSKQTHEPAVLHRAMSDPLDAQETEESAEENENSSEEEVETNQSNHQDAFPTFPRFPVADNRDRHCWSEPPVDIFSVRGPNYFQDSKKVTSGPFLLNSRGCDLLLNNNKKKEKSVPIEQFASKLLGGTLQKKPTIAVNFRFPWGYMVLYFELTAKLAPFLSGAKVTDNDHSLSTAERTLARWLAGDESYKNERLKLIPYVAKGPWIVRNMVKGRPAIIGRKLPVTYETVGQTLFCTLDIGSSSATAKQIVSVCRRYMSALTVDIGFVIQAESKDELPEQMMGSIRVHHPNPLKAPKSRHD